METTVKPAQARYHRRTTNAAVRYPSEFTCLAIPFHLSNIPESSTAPCLLVANFGCFLHPGRLWPLCFITHCHNLILSSSASSPTTGRVVEFDSPSVRSNMERQRLPRRSASHGTLRSSYTRHARPLHKPLRSVNENAALLPSPGALESMLKTTTETGDIGLFSIKPFSGSNLGLPSGSRRPAGTTEKYLPPPRRSVDDVHGPDGRRRLPSYRDTTLDIISMYGSNSQSSVASTLALSTEEPNQRSYSMTTVGSRHVSHKKSNTTLKNQNQNHPNAGPLQRPRSPFPYPTRLKRPGARPASPAVTDAGIVDYSRMVEIDRISLV